MMSLIAKCGNDCDSCPWSTYTRERMSSDTWNEFREGVKKYVGYAIQDGKPCQGCQTPTEKLAKNVGVHNFLKGCLARKCALINKVKTCAHCSRFPCFQIKTMTEGFTRETVEERIGEPIPDDAYDNYIEPFQGMKHLQEIRRTLNRDEIIKMKPIKPKYVKSVPFPDDLSLEVDDKNSFIELHSFLSKIAYSSLRLEDVDTYAICEQLDKRRRGIFRFLWIMGLHGVIENDQLVLDSISYFSNKTGEIPSRLNSMHQYQDIFSEHGLRGELMPLNLKDWLLPSGFLRSKGRRSHDPVWELRFKYNRSGGIDVLKALQKYTSVLFEKYGNRGMSRFRKADMNILV